MAKILGFTKKKVEAFSWSGVAVCLPPNQTMRDSSAESIGMMLSFARATDTALLCKKQDSDSNQYWLLLGFSSAENMQEIMHLFRSDERTVIFWTQMCSVLDSEIRLAQPLDEILPKDVLHQLLWTAAMNPWEQFAISGH